MADRVVVVGAGVVGLSCAWHLQAAGADVVVLDRGRPGSGASWGNAGQLAPALAVPLPDRANLLSGARSVFTLNSPVSLPRRPTVPLVRYLGAFAANSTSRRWLAAMRSLMPLNAIALDEFDFLINHGVRTQAVAAPFYSAFRTSAEGGEVLGELLRVAQAGYPVDCQILSGAQLLDQAPHVARARAGVRLNGQRFVDPPQFVGALADAVRERGGDIRAEAEVSAIRSHGSTVEAVTCDRAVVAGAVVVANGAWLPRLVRAHGVRVPMFAGRGYSFTVDTTSPPPPVMTHFPGPRIACTPYRGGFRVTSLMELAPVDKPLTQRRLLAFIRRAREALIGVRWDSMRDVWAGARPLTADGLPLVGATRSPGVYVAGGHGMWGVTLAPITGRLLAGLIVRGEQDPTLMPFDPLR
jgi:D-amino-acid dehydrogenase